MLDELEGAERQARSAESVARASEARTRRFVADAAHELRTPLAGVQAVAEAATSPELDVEERDRLHLLLLRETRRAGRLVDDLLALARIDAGLELRRDPVELVELANAEAERVRLLAPERDRDGGRRAGDRAGRRCPARPGAGQPAGQRPPAHARRRADHRAGWPLGPALTVRVEDSGPGVPPADRERIFDRLVRLDEARTSDDGGAGLGLAIARGIARAHGGDLQCVAPEGGVGAVFELTLPAR